MSRSLNIAVRRNLLVALASLASCLSTLVVEASLEPLGPALREPVIALYVPPTRAAEPYAATTEKVYRYDGSRRDWVAIYTSPSPETAVLGLSGYAKSSAVLYVVHSRGLARTKDSGVTWQESPLPRATGSAARFVGVAVNSTNRKEAVVVFHNAAWLTQDFGESFRPLFLPGAGEELQAVGYPASETGTVAVLTSRAFSYTSDAGDTWTAVPRVAGGAPLLALSPRLSCALIVDEQTHLTAFDLRRTGHRQSHALAPVRAWRWLEADPFGRALAWAADQTEIFAFDLQKAAGAGVLVHRSEQPITALNLHPRSTNGLFVAAANQVFLLQADHGDLQAVATNEWDLSDFQAGEYDVVKGGNSTEPTAQNADIHQLCRELQAGEPSLVQIVDAALKQAHYQPGEVTKWKKKLNKRHWFPQLRVGYGLREFPVDQGSVYSYVDRYGIPHQDDLRLSDDIDRLDNFGVALTWDLGKLFFDGEEVDVNKEKREEAKQRNELIAQITNLYYERIELLVRAKLKSERMGLDERLSLTMKIRQKTDLVNGLCGVRLLDIPALP